jgi:hypothetical protein
VRTQRAGKSRPMSALWRFNNSFFKRDSHEPDRNSRAAAAVAVRRAGNCPV